MMEYLQIRAMGGKGSAPGQFATPLHGLAVDAEKRPIRPFDRRGKFRNTIGKNNPVNGFLIPNGVVDFAVDAHGVIHAANPGKHRVERYLPTGALLGRSEEHT